MDAPKEGQEGEVQTEAVMEALLTRSLAHPHIIATYDYGISTQAGYSCLLMPSCSWQEWRAVVLRS